MNGGSVIIPLDADHFAHFVETGTEADADAISEGLLAGGIRIIEIVGGEEGHATVVVPGVDDLRHGVADPVGWLGGPEFVEDEDIGVIDRFEDAEFRRLRDRVVTVLNLLEKVTEVIEEAADSLLEEGIESGDGQMGLSNSAGAHEEESDIEDRVFTD